MKNQAAVVVLALAALFFTEPNASAQAPVASKKADRSQSRAAQAFDRLPLRFESNTGQADQRALFIARGLRSTLFLTSSEAVLSLTGEDSRAALRMKFGGAPASSAVIGEGELPGRTHYLKGAESEWRRNIVSYEQVRYREVYPGIDLVFHGRERELEFDLVVAPNANLSSISLRFDGADDVHVDEAGDLVLKLAGDAVRLKRPVAYQELRGTRHAIESDFVLSGSSVSFRVGAYEATAPLVIDPVILYATYLGGNWDDSVQGIGVDGAGNVYVAGWTMSGDFPRVAAFDNTYNSPGSGLFDNFDPRPADGFVAKLTPSGSALIYSTYFGGGLQDSITDLAVDSAGRAYLAGQTRSPNFPLTAGAFDATPNGGQDAFLAKLSADGSTLLYSTLIGSSAHDYSLEVSADNAGIAYLLGRADAGDVPITPDAYWQQYTGTFLSRFNTTAAGVASLEYSTFTGMSGATNMDIAPDGDVLLNGGLLLVPPVNGFQTSRVIDARDFRGFPSSDAAFLRVDTRAPDPSQAIVYATYLGGGYTDIPQGISAGPSNFVCLVGYAESPDFPARNAFQPLVAGATDAFVAVFDTSQQGDASLVYSTLIGGFSTDQANQCLFDGNVLHVAGETFSSDFPLRTPFQATNAFGDLFVATFNTHLTGNATLLDSSYYGGSGQEQSHAMHLDRAGGVWVGGVTRSNNLPLQDPVQPTLRFRDEGFLARFGEPGGGGGGEPQITVSAVAPNRGGAAFVTVVVHGTAFVSGASVALRRGSTTIAASPVKFISDAAIEATFNASGAATGLWDVVVTNPDGHTAVLANGFTVEPMDATIRATASISMSPILRFGRPATGYITYSNPTNVDVMLPIFIYFPRGKHLDFGIPIRHAPTIVTDPPADFSQMPMIFDTGTEQVIPLIVNVPPGHTGVIPITIREGCDPLSPTPVRVATGTPRTRTESMTCAHALISIVLSAIPLTDCLGDIIGLLNTAVGSYTGEPASMGSWITDILLAAVKCAAATVPVSAAISLAIQVAEIVAFADDTLAVLAACNGGLRPSGPGFVAADRSCVRSADPNAKYGDVGAGDAHYVTGTDALTYVVTFENLETATAAAQDVVVTDVLDPTRLNLDTFSLGPISFSGRIVTPPAGLSSYLTTVDLRPGINLLLSIDARLDRPTNTATWRFTSLDPSTGQPTTDPVLGFLPPNVTSPEGEGAVMFTAAPVSVLATGDVIRNNASIVFDVNAPIVTGEWTNAIDKMSPTSSVVPLSSPQTAESFTVQWSGTDAGSGVADYSVFVSVNGGAFTEWLAHTTATSATYPGAFGGSHAFYSIARDRTGHVEIGKSTAEASVAIVRPVYHVAGSGAVAPETAAYRATFSLDVTGSDTATGTLRYYYSRTRLNLVSTTITAVTASGPATIRGTATVNGVSGFTFTATASETAPQAFGIEIRRSDGSVLFTTAASPLVLGSLTITP